MLPIDSYKRYGAEALVSLTKKAVLRFSKYGFFRREGIREKKTEKNGSVLAGHSQDKNCWKADKCWAFGAIPPGRTHENSF